MKNTFPYVDRTPRVLVVDDKAQNRKLLWAILAPEGYEVLEAASGLEALELIRDEPLDVVLLDVLMPGIDGIETCRRIREELGYVTLPVVFITALSDRLSRIRGQSVGGDDFLSKPIDEIELLVRVKNLLKAKAYHDLQKEHANALEREVDILREQLMRVERLATLGTLAGGVGHELNNLLTVFHGSLFFLREQHQAEDTHTRSVVSQLERVADHIQTHASHLLSLARPGPDSSEDVDLAALIRDTINMLVAAGRLRGTTIRFTPTQTQIFVHANRTRLEQVLVNLLINAADAMKGQERASQIQILSRIEKQMATVHVMDTGSGISPEILDSIFDPYVTTKSADEGTGLGLSVVRRILEKLEGRIWVNSTDANGTDFAFELPAIQVSSSI